MKLIPATNRLGTRWRIAGKVADWMWISERENRIPGIHRLYESNS